MECCRSTYYPPSITLITEQHPVLIVSPLTYLAMCVVLIIFIVCWRDGVCNLDVFIYFTSDPVSSKYDMKDLTVIWTRVSQLESTTK